MYSLGWEIGCKPMSNNKREAKSLMTHLFGGILCWDLNKWSRIRNNIMSSSLRCVGKRKNFSDGKNNAVDSNCMNDCVCMCVCVNMKKKDSIKFNNNGTCRIGIYVSKGWWLEFPLPLCDIYIYLNCINLFPLKLINDFNRNNVRVKYVIQDT